MKFQDLLREYRIKFYTEGQYCRPGWIQFFCPHCRGGSNPNRPYCGYNIFYRYVNCWRCGSHTLIETLGALTGFSAEKCRSLITDLERGQALVPREERRGNLVLPRGVGKMEKAHKAYLLKRGFDPNEIESLWQVKGIGMVGQLPWRLFIPIVHHGQTVSWTTRTIGNSASRYISASPQEESLNHRHLLYGEDFCRHAVVVHEGPTDVWSTGPGAIATMGVGYSREQLERLSHYVVRVVCFDNEPAAQRRARKLTAALGSFPGDTYNIVLDAKDPAEASEDEIKLLRGYLE